MNNRLITWLSSKFSYLLTCNSKGLQVSLCKEPKICVNKYIYIIKSTNFSQTTSDPIPHHMPTIKNKVGGKPLRATINGIKALSTTKRH